MEQRWRSDGTTRYKKWKQRWRSDGHEKHTITHLDCLAINCEHTITHLDCRPPLTLHRFQFSPLKWLHLSDRQSRGNPRIPLGLRDEAALRLAPADESRFLCQPFLRRLRPDDPHPARLADVCSAIFASSTPLALTGVDARNPQLAVP